MISIKHISFLLIKKIFLGIIFIILIFLGPAFVQTIGFNDYWLADNTHGPILTWSDIPGQAFLNTSTSITISWETNEPTTSLVEFGTTQDLGQQISDPTKVKFHNITLTGLQPNTRYYYRVSTLEGPYGEISKIYSFITPPSTPSNERVHFAIYGDTRDPINALQAVANGMYSINQADPYNFIVHVGDIVGHGGNRVEWNQFFKRVEHLHASAPIVPVIGNHEFYREGNEDYADEDFPELNSSNPEHYLKYFNLPGNEKYYSLDFANIHYIILDSNNPGGTFYRKTDPDKNAQAQWLYDDLRAHNSTTGWIFVSFHHPFIESTIYNITTPEGPRNLTISQIFHEGGVDGIFIGHVHTYERQWHNDSGTTIPYVITGGGGASIDKHPHWGNLSVAAVPNTFQFMDFSVMGGNIDVNIYDINGNIIDSFHARNYKWEVDA